MMNVELCSFTDLRFQNLVNELYSDAFQLAIKKSNETENIKYCILAMKNNKVSGRLAIYENDQLLWNKNRTWTVGLYEALEDENIAFALFRKVSELAAKHGISYVLGPMNGSTWNSYRLPENNETIFFTEQVYKNYYSRHFIKNGFDTISEYYSAIDREINHRYSSRELSHELKKRGIRIRNISLQNYESELKALHPVILGAFKDNFLFTPLCFNSFLEKYLPLKHFIKEPFFIIAEDELGQIIGFILCLDDHYNIKEKSLIAKTLVRIPGQKWQGLATLLCETIMIRAKEMGYQSIIHAFMHDKNRSLAISNHFSNNILKKYKLYVKQI